MHFHNPSIFLIIAHNRATRVYWKENMGLLAGELNFIGEPLVYRNLAQNHLCSILFLREIGIYFRVMYLFSSLRARPGTSL